MVGRDNNSIKFEVVDDAVAAIMRSKTPADRLRLALEANDTMRLIVAAGARSRHPDWTESQIRREVARRMLGDADRTVDIYGRGP